MKLHVNENCIGCGLCASICPEVFEMDENNMAKAAETVGKSAEAAALEAQENCPAAAIEREEEQAAPSNIKNIAHEKILCLADEISAEEGQVVSKTLAQNDYVSITLFAFSKGEEIGTHDSSGDAMVTVLEGRGKFIVDGKQYNIAAGETLVMPAKKPHSAHAEDAFKMLLTVVFPTLP